MMQSSLERIGVMRANWQNLNHGPESAFALRELLATISTILLLSFLAAPAVSKLRTTGNSAVCLSNHKELIVAWQMYANENSGRLVENYHGGNSVAAANASSAPWACGWLDWGTSPDNTNTLYLRGPKYARISPYLRSDRNVHKCPADVYLGPAQQVRGWKERVRSYSMNLTIGNGNAMTGPWDPIYKQAKRVDEFIYPTPAESTVMLDEHPGSINDPGFFPPFSSNLIDAPGNLHKGAGTISFADAHAEVHPWKGRLRSLSAKGGWATAPVLSPDPDHSWVSYHSQRQGPESY